MIARMDPSLLEDMTSKNTSYWYTLLSFLLPLLPSPLPLSPHIHLPWNSVDFAHRPRSGDKITDLVLFDDPGEHHVGNRPRHRFPRRGEIIEAATMANIHKFISSLPEWLQHTRGGTRRASSLVGRNKRNRMCLFFSFIFFCYFRFTISSFDFWFSIFTIDFQFSISIY